MLFGCIREPCVAPDVVITTDEASAYTELSARQEHNVVVHAQEFSSPEGGNQNQAEPAFTRLRRLLHGQIYKMHHKHADVYAHEIAHREDTRRCANGANAYGIFRSCLVSLASRDWIGYWQGSHRLHDSLVTLPLQPIHCATN